MMKEILIALVIVLIILFVFNDSICKWVKSARQKITSSEKAEGCCGGAKKVPGTAKYLEEHKDVPAKTSSMEEYEATDSSVTSYRKALEGFDGARDLAYINDGEWQQWIMEDELDPSVQKNHSEFVKDVSRFYTGASFTSVDEDNRDVFSTNFIGLRRPKHVEEGANVRQTGDYDPEVLKRNKRFLL